MAGKQTNLDNPDDTAVYWIPTLHLTDGWQGTSDLGQPSFRTFFAYYRCFDHANTCTTAKQSESYPADTRLVTGNAHQAAAVPLNTNMINWTCDERSSRVGPYPDIQTANCATATGKVFLTLHLDFPSCWDGVPINHPADQTGDTSDNAHFAFPQKGGVISPNSGGTCPAGFPHRIMELRETFKWGDGTAAYWNGKYPALITDIQQRAQGNPVTAGQTAHGDFWNTWEQNNTQPGTPTLHGGLDGMLAGCINTTTPQPWCNS